MLPLFPCTTKGSSSIFNLIIFAGSSRSADERECSSSITLVDRRNIGYSFDSVRENTHSIYPGICVSGFVGGKSWKYSIIFALFWKSWQRKPLSIGWWNRGLRNLVLFPAMASTHWGRVTQICVGNLTIIGSDNGLSPGRRRHIISTKVGTLLIRYLGTHFSELLIHTFFIKKKCTWNCCLRNGGHLVQSCWRHQMEAFSALLALCAVNSPVTG